MNSNVSLLSYSYNSSRLHYLDNMRAGAIFMVVVIHSMGYCGKLTPSQHGVISFWVHTIAVPIFFWVDGYLLLLSQRKKNAELKKFISKSFLRLMVPYLFFTFFYTGARFFFEYIGFLQDKLFVDKGISYVLRAMYGSVYAPQMYFLLSLFLVRLFILPFIKLIQTKKILIIIIFITYLFYFKIIGKSISPFLKIEGGQDPVLHALWGGQYYLLGILMYLYEDILNVLYKWILPLSIIILILLKYVIDLKLGDQLTVYSYLIGYFSVFFINRNKNIKLNDIGENTMGIYLIHTPVLMKAISIVVTHCLKDGLLSLLIISLFCFCVSYQLTITIKKIPKGKFLFGEF